MYSTVSHAGHLIHRPSGTVRRSLGSVCWIFGGSSFSSQLIVGLLVWRSRPLARESAGACIERSADFGDEPLAMRGASSRAALSSSCTSALPITTASATSATARAVRASRMPKPTPTGSFTCALIPGIICWTVPMSKWPAPVTPFSDT